MSAYVGQYVGFHVLVGSLRFLVARYDKARHLYTLRNITMIPPRSNADSYITSEDFHSLERLGLLRVKRPQRSS